MYCSFCGKEIPDESTFCGYCGKKLVYIGDRPEEYEIEGPYGGERDSWFVTPSWGYYAGEYEEAWEEDDASYEEAVEEAGASGSAAAEGETGSASSEAPESSDGEAVGGTDVADDIGAEVDSDDNGGSGDDGNAADSNADSDSANTEVSGNAADSGAEEGPSFGPVRAVRRPLTEEAFADAAASGVFVPSRVIPGASAPRKRRVPVAAVAGIAAAALVVGAVGAFAVSGPVLQLMGLGAQSQATAQPASQGEAGRDSSADQNGGQGAVAEDGQPTSAADASNAGGDAAKDGEGEDPVAETGFSSAKKLVAALETPLTDALDGGFSRATMRLLVIDEIDFMMPAYAEALARDAGFSTVKEYARNVKDTEAEQFGKYAGTWSFKLERGKKCSTRAVERIERQCQLLGVEASIGKAYKIEAVTSNYPPDYDSKNVDDEGLYHNVTPYTAIQVDGRWYLYTDALAVEKTNDGEE